MKKFVTVKHIRSLIREQLLLEQEPEAAAPAAPAPAAAAPAPPPAEQGAPSAPEKTGLPTDEPRFKNDSFDLQVDRFLGKYDEEAAGEHHELDVVSFSDNVANLVEKLEVLLDMKGSIVRRALNYVQKMYDENTSKRVEDILSSNFDLEPESNVDKFNDDNFPAPAADRAGPSPAGGAVGGA
jgi:hypothetical protein